MRKSTPLIFIFFLQIFSAGSQDFLQQIAFRDSCVAAIDSGVLYRDNDVMGGSPLGHFNGKVFKGARSREVSTILIVFPENSIKVYCLGNEILKITENLLANYYFFDDQVVSRKGIIVTDTDIVTRMSAYKYVIKDVLIFFPPSKAMGKKP